MSHGPTPAIFIGTMYITLYVVPGDRSRFVDEILSLLC